MSRLYTVTGRFYWCEEREQWLPNPKKMPSEAEITILEEFSPDIQGYSDWVSIPALKKKYPDLEGSLGGNGSNMFTRKIARDFNCAPTQAKNKNGNRVVERRFYGLVQAQASKQAIRSDIKKIIEKQPCVVLGTTSDTQVDHKDGRKIDPRVLNLKTQRLDDFQPLHKTANMKKREVCAKCTKTNQRFDARSLGYPIAYTEGRSQYEGTCKGCFWYDPKTFRTFLVPKN